MRRRRFGGRSPLQLVGDAVLTAIGLAIVFAAIVTILFFIGGPASSLACGETRRAIGDRAELADRFDADWRRLNAALDGGEVLRIELDESETTSRASRHLAGLSDSPFGDVVICFSSDGGETLIEASAETDIPVLPDRRVRVRGTVDLSGPVPVAQVDDVKVGSVFGAILGFAGVESAIEDEINEELAKFSLRHRYDVRIDESILGVGGAE